MNCGGCIRACVCNSPALCRFYSTEQSCLIPILTVCFALTSHKNVQRKHSAKCVNHVRAGEAENL